MVPNRLRRKRALPCRFFYPQRFRRVLASLADLFVGRFSHSLPLPRRDSNSQRHKDNIVLRLSRLTVYATRACSFLVNDSYAGSGTNTSNYKFGIGWYFQDDLISKFTLPVNTSRLELAVDRDCPSLLLYTCHHKDSNLGTGGDSLSGILRLSRLPILTMDLATDRPDPITAPIPVWLRSWCCGSQTLIILLALKITNLELIQAVGRLYWTILAPHLLMSEDLIKFIQWSWGFELADR